MPIKLLCQRLDAALIKRVTGIVDDYENERCEVCQDLIRRYIGPKPGVICTTCLTSYGGCNRIAPLAITRSAIREK